MKSNIIKNIIEGIDVENILKDTIDNLYRNGTDNFTNLEILTYIKIYQSDIFDKYESSILLKMGLFFKNLKPLELRDLVFSVYKETIEDEYKNTFTPIQANIVKQINSNKMFSFSSPTSTGKSYVFRHIINSYQNDIVIIVPSRALINEYQNLVKGLVDEKKVNVLTYVDIINKKHTERSIYIITPERTKDLFSLKSELNINIIMFDEAQLSDDYSVRGLYYDSVIRRCYEYFKDSKFIFAYPFVDNPEVQYKKNMIDYTESNYKKFTQRNVGQIFYSFDDDMRFFHFGIDTETLGNRYEIKYDPVERVLDRDGSVLIYCHKKRIYNGDIFKQFEKYLNKCNIEITDQKGLMLIETFREFIGASKSNEGDYVSKIVELMKRGIVVHHGSLPLQARYVIEEFVKNNYCKICFATSTLEQGINMPFDLVWVEKFEKSKPLNVKNIIGRAGRSTDNSKFDYGSIVIKDTKKSDLKKILLNDVVLDEISQLDKDSSENDDYSEYKEAIKNNDFSEEFNMTNSELERVQNDSTSEAIEKILDDSFKEGDFVCGTDKTNVVLSDNFKIIYENYLNRPLTQAEKGIINTTSKILVWKIIGKKFSQIVWYRYSYASKTRERKDLRNKIINSESEKIKKTLEKEYYDLDPKYVPMYQNIPNKNLMPVSLTKGYKAYNVDYDQIVMDTYDYLDKLIGFRLGDCYYAAFYKYYEKTNDDRALKMSNYIKYGTNDLKEILLLRYGFIFEEFDWLKPVVKDINEDEIVFQNIESLTEEQYKRINKYLNN